MSNEIDTQDQQPENGSAKVRKPLTYANFFKLVEWMKVTDISEVTTVAQGARMASNAIGAKVSDYSFTEAMAASGKEIARRANIGAGPKDRTLVVARSLAKLYRHVGIEPDSALLKLAGYVERVPGPAQE